jgi:hypothetical protein
MLTQLLANSDSFRRQIIEQASPPQQKLLQALHYGAAQTFAPYGTFGPALQPGTSKGDLLHELMTQITDTKVPTPRQIAGERYGEQKAKEEARTRRNTRKIERGDPKHRAIGPPRSGDQAIRQNLKKGKWVNNLLRIFC